MTQYALSVELKAKPGKEEEVAAFLKSAQSLVQAESGTVAWFALRLDTQTFAIVDAFDDEAGREAHLNGAVASLLIAKSGELLAQAPQIRKAEVLADKVP
ncbi:putative quinol monooxygenase [Dyella sp.]|uniref:putative quinol monooxygenase n=1 Tax=Dyella sp. TaxID=1869338 RepID=UPI002ECFCF55